MPPDTTQLLSILVVDDDRDHADSLAELFAMEGHEVTVAYSGDEATAAYRARDFDLAFLDVIMPGKNGVESFLEIKRVKPDARIYMMTGYSVEQLLQQAVDNGAVGVLAKPIDVNKVLTTLDEVKHNGIVLVAEDDHEFGPELKQVIERAGRACELVTNGRDALSRMAKGGVEVLILDLNLPLINGIEVYTALRQVTKQVPTVLITACRDQYRDELDSLSDIELTGILTKPFEPDQLLNKLARLTAHGRASTTVSQFEGDRPS